MLQTKFEKIQTMLEDDLSLAVEVARELHSYDGSLDWVDAVDFEELCYIAAEGGAEAVESLCWACFNGDTCGGRVRYNAYGNLEPADEETLLDDASNYMDDIMNTLYMQNYDVVTSNRELNELLDSENIITVLATNINYDIDKEDLEEYNGDKARYIEEYDLPLQLEIEVDLDECTTYDEMIECIRDNLADLISDETGYCVLSCDWEEVEEE